MAAGLDPQSRKILNEVLARLHIARSPRIILGIRQGEGVPDCVTHILRVRDGTASGSVNDSIMQVTKKYLPIIPVSRNHKIGDVVVDMKDVNVTYGTRKVTHYRS